MRLQIFAILETPSRKRVSQIRGMSAMPSRPNGCLLVQNGSWYARQTVTTSVAPPETHMPRKRLRVARLDQVRISRDGEDAIIEHRDPGFATVHLRIGPEVNQMTNEEILLAFNQTIAAQIRNRDELGEYVAVELPAGKPQVAYHPGTENQWSPRGGVLRCVIDDGGGEDGLQPIIQIDDQEFSWEEFGRMLCTYAGWGMRIVFVPDDELDKPPKIAVRDPDD